MSSQGSGSIAMDNKTGIPKDDELEALVLENTCLQEENAELRMLIGLVLENRILRSSVKNQNRRTRSLSPPKTREKTMKDTKKFHQIIGEIAFQLDRRILGAVFLDESRLYGYRVADIEEKINQVTTCAVTGKVNEELRSELYLRYHHTMDQLKKLGYDPAVHPYLTEYLVNTYGVMDEQTRAIEHHHILSDVQFLRKMIIDYMPANKVKDVLVILNCLAGWRKHIPPVTTPPYTIIHQIYPFKSH